MVPQAEGRASGSSSDNDSASGIFERLLSLVFGSDDPEREKRRQLKQIAKKLKRIKYKYYKPRTNEAEPQLARFVFGAYKVVGPSSQLLQNAESSNALRNILIDSYLTEEQRQQKAVFEEEHIRSRAKEIGPKELTAELKKAMNEFFSSFENDTVKRINATYNLIRTFLAFADFDFYFMLRKFDSALPEGSYNYKPKFESITAEYITDDLKDLLEVMLPLDSSAKWDEAFDALKNYKGTEVINRDAWKKLLSDIDAHRKSEVFTLIVRHATEDPSYVPEPAQQKHRIVEPYLNTLKTTAEATLQKISAERRQKKVEQLVQQIFGTTVVTRTKNYTEKANPIYQKRMLAGFTHTEPLNYLKAFLLDYFKKDVREIVRDVIVVRGRWADGVSSKQLSEAFHEVMNVSEQVVTFDDSLGAEGELGMKLRKASGKVVDKDQQSMKQLRDVLATVNEQASSMVSKASSNLVTIAKHLKSLIEDYDRENPELILNWKELDGYVEEPLRERMTEIYKQIYYFAQLMHIYVKK
jgi:hypothetical protein